MSTERRYKRVRISRRELMQAIFQYKANNKNTVLQMGTEIPEGCEIVDVRDDFGCMCLDLIIFHPSFPIVEDFREIPLIDEYPMFRLVDPMHEAEMKVREEHKKRNFAFLYGASRKAVGEPDPVLVEAGRKQAEDIEKAVIGEALPDASYEKEVKPTDANVEKENETHKTEPVGLLRPYVDKGRKSYLKGFKTREIQIPGPMTVTVEEILGMKKQMDEVRKDLLTQPILLKDENGKHIGHYDPVSGNFTINDKEAAERISKRLLGRFCTGLTKDLPPTVSPEQTTKPKNDLEDYTVMLCRELGIPKRVLIGDGPAEKREEGPAQESPEFSIKNLPLPIAGATVANAVKQDADFVKCKYCHQKKDVATPVCTASLLGPHHWEEKTPLDNETL